MTISSQICKRTYQADGETRRWSVDFPYLSLTELKVYRTDSSGNETDVSAQCILDEIEREIIYPTLASEVDLSRPSGPAFYLLMFAAQGRRAPDPFFTIPRPPR